MANIKLHIATEAHFAYAQEICDVIEASAKVRGTGIAKRKPEYIRTKMANENAIIALDGHLFAGFCYIEIWSGGKYVAHSGLIVHPNYRNMGLAKKIKKYTFEYSLQKFPEAKIFGITTGLAVMKINSELGYKPVTFSELTDDPKFWSGCQTCTNFEILNSKSYKMCLCTGMMYDPSWKHNSTKNTKQQIEKRSWFDETILRRLKKIKMASFFKLFNLSLI